MWLRTPELIQTLHFCFPAAFCPLITSSICFQSLPGVDLLCVPLRTAQRELQGSSSTGAALQLPQCNPFPPAHAGDRHAVWTGWQYLPRCRTSTPLQITEIWERTLKSITVCLPCLHAAPLRPLLEADITVGEPFYWLCFIIFYSYGECPCPKDSVLYSKHLDVFFHRDY